ncbi:hypothetical protein C8R47DRAFT_1197593 [Mycena vitilis]|nr:hypothetical protein C8R47DRAFT_1197593 [Mycena vitilis]
MSSKSASRKLSVPGAVSYKPLPHGGSSDPARPRALRAAMNFGPVSTLLTFLVFSCVIAPCRAQGNKVFQWSFSGNALSQSLPSCRSFPITVKPFDPTNTTAHGVPPFYMNAFAIGGTPTTSLIGTDESNLAWTVDQPVGAKLLLNVVDSTGSSGGVPPQLFTVVTGQSTQCIPAADTGPAFTISANVTDTLNTCQPWGVKVVGGVPPYIITLAAVNSPVTTNATFGPVDDQFTFIDRADPKTQLIAAVSDLNGRWATGTPVVNTAGSTDVSCTGLVSSSGNSTQIAAEEKAASATSKARKQTAVIAGVVVTIVVLLLLGGIAAFLYRRRAKLQRLSPRKFEGASAENVQEAGGQILSINAFISPTSPTQTSQPRSAESPRHSVLSHSMSQSTAAPFDRRRFADAPESVQSMTSVGSGLSVRNPGNLDRPAAFTSFPTASVRRSAKEIEAGLGTSHSMGSEYSDGADSHMSSRPLVERSQSAMAAGSGAGGRGAPSRSASLSAATGEEMVFQHQDAGMLRELPPPYADRGREP